MQDYYNYTTKYQWGGEFITKFLGQGLRNARTLLNDSKIVPRLNGLSRSFEVVDANFSKLENNTKDYTNELKELDKQMDRIKTAYIKGVMKLEDFEYNANILKNFSLESENNKWKENLSTAA